ncbi:MAG: hypothetical protein R2698_02670 [Microthrixaceae bacterium]
MGRDPLANPAYERVCEERPGFREWAEGKMLRCSPAMYAAMLLEMTATEDRLDALRTLSIPTLVMVGELDTPFLAASARLAQAISTASLVTHPGGGHSPQFEATEHWRASLHRFLGRG